LTGPDPNKDRNDPMVPEYWRLGEDLQDTIVNAGYAADVVDGIAVDIHDLLQAADRIRDELAPALVSSSAESRLAAVAALRAEFFHIQWHADAAAAYLAAAADALGSAV
jgi:hypothetical protein